MGIFSISGLIYDATLLMNSKWNVQSPAFLEQVDTALAAIQCRIDRNSTFFQEELCEITRCENALDLGKFGHFAMVDDERGVLREYIPALIYATRGAASQILFQDNKEPVTSIVNRVKLVNPDVLLLDYRLSGSEFPPFGTDVVPHLRDLRLTMRIIGFSSNPSNEERFRDAGADGFVTKLSPIDSVPQLRNVLEQLAS